MADAGTDDRPSKASSTPVLIVVEQDGEVELNFSDEQQALEVEVAVVNDGLSEVMN